MVVDYVPVIIEIVCVVVHAIRSPRNLGHRLTTVDVWVDVIVQIISNLVWKEVAIVIGSPLEELELSYAEVCYPEVSVVLHVYISVGD